FGGCLTGGAMTDINGGSVRARLSECSGGRAGNRSRWRRGIVLTSLVAFGVRVGFAHAASADVTTRKFDNTPPGLRRRPHALKPPVSKLFDTPVSGQIYGQPLVYGNTVIVATQNDVVYGINKATGAISWQASLGTPEPSTVIHCGAISPNYGATATPVID